MISQMLQRHHLIWLDPLLDVTPCTPDFGHAAFVRGWAVEERPFVVARQPKQSLMGATHIALGLSLPKPATRQRISLYVPKEAILRQSAPMELRLSMAPAPHWQMLISRILDICTTAHVTPCVYGSLLWQTISNREYITDTSDLDVLFVCNNSSNMNLLLDSLASLNESGPRLDGEILAPAGWAVAWRELATVRTSGAPVSVLAKSLYDARLISLDEFFKGKWGVTC